MFATSGTQSTCLQPAVWTFGAPRAYIFGTQGGHMPIPRVTLDSYATKYETVKIERRNGNLQMTMHTNNRKVI